MIRLLINRALLLLILSPLLAAPAMAQEPTPFGTSDPEAKAILDKAAKEYASYTSLKADFTLKTTNAEDKLLGSQEGTIWLKGNSFKFQLGSQIVFSDGTTLWSYNKDNNEVQITNYEPEKGQITPSSLFSDFYDKNFLYRLKGTSELKGKEVYLIQMTPFDKSKPYFQLVARITKSQYRLMGMELFTKGGYRYSYLITSYQPNVPLTASDFVFDKAKFPGVSVVDLRM